MCSEAGPDETALLTRRVQELEGQLAQATEALEAIGSGEVDALVIGSQTGKQRIYTLDSADRPYQALIDHMQEGAVLINEADVVLYCNRRFGEMLGARQEQIVGRYLHQFVLPDIGSSFSALLAAARGAQVRTELAWAPRAGQSGPLHATLSLVHHHETKTICGVLTDLTEQKRQVREVTEANTRLLNEMAERARVEEALRQAQKMEVMGQLSAGVSHDFNNILQVILGGVDILNEDTSLSRTSRTFLDIVERSAVRGAGLTNHLLSYSRQQTLDFKRIDLGRMVQDLCILLSRTLSSNIVVTTQVDAPIVPVRTDAAQLETALMNLAINASHAMPGGGTLSIDVSAADGPPFGEIGPGRHAVIAVTDTGIGMTSEVLARAFDPFFTTKGLDGTGLGLAMVQGFSRQSGGDVRVSSTLGEGTRFEVWLPEDRDVSCQAAVVGTTRSGPVGRVLVVDDTEDVLMVVDALLRKSGFTVQYAKSAQRALAALAAGERFDVLVTDYMMPGLSGVAMVRQGRDLQPGLPALIISGYADVTDVLADLADVALLRKPFKREQLVDAVSSLIMTTRDQTRH